MRRKLLAVVWLLVLIGCEKAPEEAAYRARAFHEMPGWGDSAVLKAYPAFEKTCDFLRGREVLPARAPHNPAFTFSLPVWQDLCREFAGLEKGDFRSFLERRFKAVEILPPESKPPLFTGYFVPELAASFTRSASHTTPLYGVPDDLVKVNLGLFDEEWTGRKISGRVENGALVPYYTRVAFESLAEKRQETPLVWVRDPVAAFEVHVQGSGRLAFADGSQLGIAYAGDNGHAYASIAKAMRKAGFAPEDMNWRVMKETSFTPIRVTFSSVSARKKRAARRRLN